MRLGRCLRNLLHDRVRNLSRDLEVHGAFAGGQYALKLSE
jgi:hypothetical protein